jgi:hypothetical protein
MALVLGRKGKEGPKLGLGTREEREELRKAKE